MTNNAKPTPRKVSQRELYINAIDIYLETNLTPRQLAEQRAELLEVLRFYGDEENHGDFGAIGSDNGYKARAAIAKATGGE